VNLIKENSITITTACRLHLGLMEICHQHANLFGGIGVMAESPSTCIEGVVGTVANSSELAIVADEYWKSRIANSCERWMSIRNEPHLPIKQILLHQTAPPHCGLGSGTQVACAVAAILERACDRTIPNTDQLKSLTGRGARSCVGLQGFMEGGFIVDFGHSQTMSRPSLRLTFPPEWRLLLVRVSTSIGDSGDAEQQMFHQCASHPNPNRQHMLDLIETEIVPAVQSHDWDRWDRSVGRYGYYAGSIFSKCQGGIYRTPEIGRLVDLLTKRGCLGAAQSSWGPTVLVVAKDEEHVTWLSDTIRGEFPNALLECTSPRNNPARVLRK
jgi:beta-ribofuranosylaminobenzene 5'-phosphate synthase